MRRNRITLTADQTEALIAMVSCKRHIPKLVISSLPHSTTQLVAMDPGETVWLCPHGTIEPTHRQLRHARDWGRAVGRRAAVTAVEEMSRTRVAAIVEAHDAGDPALETLMPSPPELTGERGDAPTPLELACGILGLDSDVLLNHGEETIRTLSDEWAAGVRETYTATLVDHAHEVLATP